MTSQEKMQGYDWAIQKLVSVQAQLEEKKDLLLAITTAMQMSNGNNAKAGELIRGLLEKQP
jgi:hypothetical protein